MEFPDQSKFNRVRDALWKRSQNASIMIGSGFSKNAEILGTSTSPAPSWNELTEAMCERLYPQSEGDFLASAVASSGETRGVLRLAQEFATAFGRPDLHRFLKSHVQDKQMLPGGMHKRLLRLPWRDVFTTNWDTLLERTCLEVPERSYSILRNSDEIPLAVSPRIIKLHGSLDGHFPLIVTEEDYRTYPDVFAPFVNTVQQSMMESVFCLLGFSGDDPNFLHWSGWVRDNLHTAAPKIYLAGWLELSEHRRRMLEDRNVVPIDLARYPQARSWPKALHHERATDWILRSLESGRPYAVGEWPSEQVNRTSPPPDFLLPVEGACSNVHKAKQPLRLLEDAKDSVDEASAVKELVGVWSYNRQKTYPGWLAAPFVVRRKLSAERYYVDKIVDLLPNLSTLEALSAIREIIWRRQIQLEPLSLAEETSVTLADHARRVLDRIDCLSQTVDGETPNEADWPMLREAWVEVSLALLHSSRLQFDEEDFKKRIAAIEPFQEENHEIQNHIMHERSLWAIFSLDYASVADLLTEWHVETSDPVWMMRKAALLFEIGENEKAERLNLLALEKTRQSHVDDEDLGILSRESWALFCAGASLGIKEFWYASVDWQYRWEKLTPVKCNAPLEMRYYAEEIRGESKPAKGRPFDIGHVWRGGFSSSSAEYQKWIASHRAVRLLEVAGLPPRVRNRAVGADLLESAARQLVPHEAELSARLVLRAARNKSDGTLNVVLSRTNIAVMSLTSVIRLTQICNDAIEYALPRVEGNNVPRYWPERLAVLIESLSRLLVRLEAGEVSKIFDNAIRWYRDNLVAKNYSLGDPMQNLMSRSWAALSHDQRKEKMLDVLQAPIVGLDGFVAGETVPNNYADTSAAIARYSALKVERTRESESRWQEIIGLLVRGLRTEGEARKRAFRRLLLLVELKVATQSELTELANALWERNKIEMNGLPSGTNIVDWAFLVLPEPVSGLAEERFRAKWLNPKLLEGASPPPAGRVLWEVGEAIANLRTRGIPFRLSDDEEKHLLEMVRQWILEPVPRTLPSSVAWSAIFIEAAYGDVQRAIAGLGHILLKVRIPVAYAEDLLKKWRRLNLTEMPARVLSAGLIRALPQRSVEVVQSLRAGLASDDSKVAQDAMLALQFWLKATRAIKDGLMPVPVDLVHEVGVIISVRRMAALVLALQVAKWIMDEGNVEHQETLGTLVVQGLRYLYEELQYETAQGKDIDVPLLRRESAELAASMSGGNWAEETAVMRWVESLKHDPLPEIRRIADNLK